MDSYVVPWSGLARTLCSRYSACLAGRRYHRLRWVTPTRPYLQRGKHYLFLHFPHAVFPMGSWLSTPVTGDEGTDMKALRM